MSQTHVQVAEHKEPRLPSPIEMSSNVVIRLSSHSLAAFNEQFQ